MHENIKTTTMTKTNKAFRENKKLMQEQASKNLAPKYAVNYRLLTYESKAFKINSRPQSRKAI
jgi:hypothetical protein